MKKNEFNITIVGGGPVGLFLGICLSKVGINCIILEKRTKPVPDSRSLGIHPVSLELFQQLGFSDDFLDAGISIEKGIAHTGKKKLGEIDFSQLQKPFNFILACPQFKTERILTRQFLELNPDGFINGAEVISVSQSTDSVTCEYRTSQGDFEVESSFLIGCDGKNSLVRRETDIPFEGKRYTDTYIMCDVEDTTDFGDKAVVFLPKDGLIECFPLPNNMRRWVVKTDDFIKKPTQAKLSDLILKRIGFDISIVTCSMLSTFGVQQFTAESFIENRILLAGDAAHVVSPIGGQGMNLGWLGAWKLSQALEKISCHPENKNILLEKYQKEQKRILKTAARRAEWNMKLGRKQLIPLLKKALVMAILRTPLSKSAAKIFSMRGL
jgi:2-polyprenyl-6-methoxyphenol hydroxylase-like FAD-dependent oxidoreductase